MNSLEAYLFLGAFLFCLGIFGVMTRRNVVGILVSIELILNAANINLVAFNRFIGTPDGLGQVFALLVVAIAAAASVVGLVLVIAIYRNGKSVFADQYDLMKW